MVTTEQPQFALAVNQVFNISCPGLIPPSAPMDAQGDWEAGWGGTQGPGKWSEDETAPLPLLINLWHAGCLANCPDGGPLI